MGRKGRKRPAELVLRLVEIGAQALVEQLRVPEAQARAAMREIAHLLATEYGGQEMYVPKDEEFKLVERDLALWRAYTGTNIAELAQRFDITERQVRNILRHLRQQKRSQQHSLPGMDEPAAPPA